MWRESSEPVAQRQITSEVEIGSEYGALQNSLLVEL